MRFLFILLFTLTSLFASLHEKSAIVYYGKNISYPMVGIHDYIIVQPNHISTYSHGFKRYREKIYAYVSIGEIDKTTPEYKEIKREWILAKNSAWNSVVLDLKNPEYVAFLFSKLIEPQRKRGFKNFFFDTLDSYQLASKTEQQREANKEALIAFIKEFHKRYPRAKLIINRGFEIIESVHDAVDAVLFESYLRGIGGKKLAYKKVSDADRKWLDVQIQKIQKYNKEIICVDYLPVNRMKEAKQLAQKISAKGMIPYIANRDLDTYGISSKNAIKREIFTLIDERRLDRTLLEAHQYGGLVFEYMGYVQRLHDINSGLPDVKKMHHYAGVVIWMQDFVKKPTALIKWVKELHKAGIKVVFAHNFAMPMSDANLRQLGLKITKKVKHKNRILIEDAIMGYEVEPSLSVSSGQVISADSQALLTYEMEDGTISTPAAFTPWGGYAVGDAFMVTIDGDNIWVINPFAFFKKALGLEELIVPDVTTENGKRLLFSHVDGDGMMNRVEGDFGYYSGDVILNKILKVYHIPHSISVIGAEIAPNGLYPKISPQLMKIAQDMYALDNVEPATHTFTHPFFWDKIKNDTLDAKYRLKPKGYKFSLENELSETLAFINKNLHPKREAKEVFWSGDCAPRNNALEYVYKHNILNINGGDTTIMETAPWLANIAPLGLERGAYTQVYTGAQNENVFTNDWLGPFWGFKRVVQTFKLTNSPRRFKPIDIYYHLYSGSKQASLMALEYVFDWAIKQDTMPIFTSEYIPKVMDYYTASLARDGSEWLVSGLEDLRTIRIEKANAGVDFRHSDTVLGLKHFEKHTYISLLSAQNHYLVASDTVENNRSYLVSANGKVLDYVEGNGHQRYLFSSHVALQLEFHLAKGCRVISDPLEESREERDTKLLLHYEKHKEAFVDIACQ